MNKKMLQITIILTLVYSLALSSGFLHRDNKKIVDGDGNEIILRGIGLGGWAVQEGYMMQTNSFANPQHEIKAKIQELIGEENKLIFTGREPLSAPAVGYASVHVQQQASLVAQALGLDE